MNSNDYNHQPLLPHLLSAILLAMVVGAPMGCTGHTPPPSAPADSESLLADAVDLSGSRLLRMAQEAAEGGNRELAFCLYLVSIERAPVTAEEAIAGLTSVSLAIATGHGAAGRYVEESARIALCYRALVALRADPAVFRSFSEPAVAALFRETARVRSVGNERAKAHLIVADGLRRQAKRFWNDDEYKQAESLHKVNLAWSYHPEFTDEWMVAKAYEIWANMKDELPRWQYEQVMERDRLLIGRTMGMGGAN